MSPDPLIGVAHLTMLDVAPPDWVSLAAASGFDAVGIRAAAISPVEEPYPMAVGSAMFAETLRRMNDTGVRLLDIELVRLSADSDPAAHEQLFETGAQL